MNPSPSNPQSEDDDGWLERALRDRRTDDYIDDAGFTARVVQALPRPAHGPRRRRWLIAGAVVLGCAIAGTVAVPAFGDAASRLDFTPLTKISGAAATIPLVVLGASLLIAAGSAYWALARRS
jgi:hypothetical protein